MDERTNAEPALRRRDVIVVGASWGGVEALRQLASQLPPDLPAAIFVVLHMTPHSPSMLPLLLSRAGPLHACHPRNGEAIRPGVIYVAPPDGHMLLDAERIRLSSAARENRCRPAIDPLFRSAARAFGPRVAGVVSTGAQDDGTAGLLRVKAVGGVAIVQDPAEAFCPDMPRNALARMNVDYCLPIAAIATTIVALATAPRGGEAAARGSPMAEMELDEEHPFRRRAGG
jgi:two-component system chemotaxis response regulator CheB